MPTTTQDGKPGSLDGEGTIDTHVRLRPVEDEKLLRIAKHYGIPKAAVLRMLINNAPDPTRATKGDS